jgi:hypothetical protein
MSLTGKGIALALLAALASQASVADGVAAESAAGDGDAACKVALDAVIHVLETPNHQFMTRIEGAEGKPRSSEIIDTGIAMYVESGGKWRTSPMSPKAMQDMLTENQKRAKVTTCRLVREESIAGTPAGVYTIHNETDAGISDSTLWISKADGLPLKQEIDMTASGHERSHSEVRFVYTDVKAPTSVQ